MIAAMGCRFFKNIPHEISFRKGSVSWCVSGTSAPIIHRGRAKVNVSVKCLVLVKMYGNSPKKLFVRIIRNNDVKMNKFPLFSLLFLRIVSPRTVCETVSFELRLVSRIRPVICWGRRLL